MSFEEEFDKIVRQKAEGAEFSFDEKNWEKARKMLDAERKVAGVGISAKAYVLALLILCLGTAGYFVVNGLDAKELNSSIALNEKEKANKMPENRSEQHLKTTESESVAEKMNEKTNPSLSNTEETIANLNTGTTDKIVLNTKSSKTEHQQQSSDLTSTTLKNPSKANTSSNSFEVVKPAYKPIITAKPSTTSRPENDLPVENTASAERINSTNHNDQNENTAGDTEVGQSEVSESEKFEISSLAIVIPKSEPSVEPEITLSPINALDYFDEDYYTKEKYKKHYLDIEAGGSYLLGWKANSETDGRGFNWYAGINYGFYVTKKVSLSVGAQGYNISNIAKPFFNHTKTEYGFTSTSTQTMITAKSLYYAAIPLKIAYSINPQSQIGVGCNVGLLVSSRNVMDTYYYQSDVRTDKTSINTKGFYDGMNTTNIQLSVFYKTKLSSRLFVNAEALYTPSDIYRYANSSINTANNVGFRLGLQYTLLER